MIPSVPLPRRPESGGFRCRYAAPPPSGCAPQNRRTHAAPVSSLSLSLKASPFCLLAHLLRLRCSVSLRSHCASGPTQMGDRSTPAFQAERQEIAAPHVPLFAPLPRPVTKTCRLWLPLARLSTFAGPSAVALRYGGTSPPSPGRRRTRRRDQWRIG